MDTIEEYGNFKIVRGDDGLLGLIYRDELIVNCNYNEITRMDEYFLCRKKGLEKYIDFDGEIMSQTSWPDDSHEEKGADGFIFVCDDNQKYGVLSPGRQAVLPTRYDEVYKWPDCNVISAREGNRVTYFDTNGEQILTNVREIKGATDRLYPYYYGEPQTNVVQLMDMSSNCDGDDYCECHGARAGLSRRLREEHASHVQTLANVKPFKDVDIDSFLAWDCYIFASFAVDSENGVIGCINRLKDIGCFESSWTWNFVVLYPTKPSKEQIEETEWLFKCLEEDQWAQSVCGVAFGEDETVKGVKVLGTRYFRDHWPTDEDWKDMSRGEDESLEELKEYFSSCCDNVKQKRDQTLSNIINQNDNEGDLEENWNLKHEKLEFMLSLGAVISNCAVFDLIHSIDYRGKEERKSVLKTLSWLLEHGANVNGVRHGQSSLDCLSKSLLTDVCKFEDLESFRGLLLAHGGKNAFELRTEECRKRGVEPVIFFTDN